MLQCKCVCLWVYSIDANFDLYDSIIIRHKMKDFWWTIFLLFESRYLSSLSLSLSRFLLVLHDVRIIHTLHFPPLHTCNYLSDWEWGEGSIVNQVVLILYFTCYWRCRLKENETDCEWLEAYYFRDDVSIQSIFILQ